MAGKTTTASTKAKKPEPREIMFLCRRCETHKPLADMRTVTRFAPVLVVCKDCAKELR